MPGTTDHPLRVAVIGAGPAGFYAAEHLLKQESPVVAVDLFDRLPTPYGLVRFGVAPDHEKIKNVTRVFDKTAAHGRFRFFGNVDLGTHLTLDDLRAHYHQVFFATGAQVDRELGIPGEHLAGSHSATEFVAWYNGHPDYAQHTFDLSQERVAVVGVGNVAIDVARILCRSHAELATTDIADYALEALRQSRVREVYLLGRRGPAQAAFTVPEIKEMGELAETDVYIPSDEAALDPLSAAELERNPDRETSKKVEILHAYAQRSPEGRRQRLVFRFCVAPVEVLDDGAGRIGGLRIVKNELYDDRGRIAARPTGVFELLDVGLVFRSVGYKGVALPGVPFDEKRGVIPNDGGRVFDPATQQPLTGLYAGGWIKRGPSGVIGTNKPDAVETVQAMLEDRAHGHHLTPATDDPAVLLGLVARRQPHYVTFDDWKRLDALEVARGQAQGRPRVKFTAVDDLLRALGR
jgi:ferredoxin--NADP+ reductase